MSCNVPDSWSSGPVLNFFQLQRGHDLPLQDRKPGNVPVIASNGQVGWHNQSLLTGPAVVTGRSGTIGNVSFVQGAYWPLNTTLYVRDFKGSDPEFIYYFLQHFPLKDHATGTGIPTLNRNDVHAVEVVFPPLDEQRRIAEVLRSVDDAIAAAVECHQQAETALEGTRATLLKPGAGGTGLGKVCDVVGGYAFKSASFIDDGVKVLRISNITEAGVDFSDRSVCVSQENVQGLDRYRLRPLDTVVALSGATTGKMCVFASDETVYANQRVAFIRVKEGLAEQSYINHTLSLLTSIVRQSAYGGAQPNISTKEISAMVIGLPSLSEQREIAGVLDALSLVVLTSERAMRAHQATKSELMSDLLSGRMRVPA